MVVVQDASPEGRHAFVAEWLDPNSGIRWKYQLFHYPASDEVEMHDVKNRRVFLKRSQCDVPAEDFYVGSTVTLYSRHLKITAYGDDSTRDALESRTERTCAVVKPSGIRALGKLLRAVAERGLTVSRLRMVHLDRSEAEAFYADHAETPSFARLVNLLCGGRAVAMELVGKQAVGKFREMLSPDDSEEGPRDTAESIHTAFGTETMANTCHGSDSTSAAAKELDFLFEPRRARKCSTSQGTSLGIIKPHALRSGMAGPIIDAIQEKFAITGMEMFSLDPANAAEFYEVYRGVVNPAEYSGMVNELVSGPFIAIEISDPDGTDAVEPFRELCGPTDPDIARVLRNKSLRARFGLTKVQNAVHCTDLPEDGELEVNYFFSILQA